MKEIDTGLLVGLTDVSSYNKMIRKKREMKKKAKKSEPIYMQIGFMYPKETAKMIDKQLNYILSHTNNRMNDEMNKMKKEADSLGIDVKFGKKKTMLYRNNLVAQLIQNEYERVMSDHKSK
tara:strand:+ start:2319 stop:2681 length:363 start_codon:yes stop_codon:yes gene_type:complete